MQFSLSLILSLLSVLVAGQDLVVGQFSRPTEDDFRSPCPAFNVLSNHGYFPRNGSVPIPYSEVIKHFHEVLGVSKFLLNVLIKGSKLGNNNTISFKDLREHDRVEHDASLFRNDFYFGDNWSVNQTLVEQLISLSSDGKTISFDDLARFRVLRCRDSKANNPTFKFGLKQEIFAFHEAANFIRVVSGSGLATLEKVRAFALEERLPIEEGWVKGSYTFADWNAYSALIKFKAVAFGFKSSSPAEV